MRRPEQRLYDTFRSHKPRDARIVRVENLTGDGTPDTYVLRSGVSSWVELKVLEIPKRKNTPFLKERSFRPGQLAWHVEQAHYGGRSFVLARDDDKLVFLIPGKFLEQCIGNTRDQLIGFIADWPTVWARLGRRR